MRFFTFSLSLSGTLSESDRQFEKPLKIPSNFPFNNEKLIRSSVDQALVFWLIGEKCYDPMYGFYYLTHPESSRVIPVFYFHVIGLPLKTWTSPICFIIKEKTCTIFRPVSCRKRNSWIYMCWRICLHTLVESGPQWRVMYNLLSHLCYLSKKNFFTTVAKMGHK